MNKAQQLIAALALTTSVAAFAQGTPPTTAPPNPATAAGTQNPVGGPMGTTGTTPQNNSATGAGSAGQSSGSATMNNSSSAGDTAVAPTRRMRAARADRN